MAPSLFYRAGMDRPLDAQFRTRRNRIRLAGALVAVGAIAGTFAISRAAVTPSVDRSDLRTARVERAPVAAAMAASGTVVPLVEKVIASPIEARVMRIVRHTGASVAAGEEIVLLDSSEAELALGRIEQRLAQKLNERSSVDAKLEAAISQLAAEVEQKQLDAEILQYREKQTESLRSEGLVSEEAYRQAVVASKKAAIELVRLEERIASEKASARRDLQALDLEIGVLRREMEQSREELGRSTARADRPGVLTWVTPQEGALLRRGDPIARVADLGSLRVAGSVSDVHADQIRAGMRARVRSGEQRLDGRVIAVDPSVANGVVRFLVAIDGSGSASLRNNQRVDIDLFTGSDEEALSIPRGTYGVADGSDVVFRIEGDEAVRTPVRLGRSDNEKIEVVEGLREGDEIVVSDMSEMWHARKVDVRD